MWAAPKKANPNFSPRYIPRPSSVLLLGLVFLGIHSTQAREPKTAAKGYVVHEWFKFKNHGYHIVFADLPSGKVSAGMSHTKGLSSVWSLVRLGQPVAAITGTFFHMNTQRPVADVLVDGNVVAKGFRGSAIGVDWYGGIKIFDTAFQQPVDWALYRYGLRGAVRILTQGVVNPNPRAQKFKDSRIWGKAPRTAVGLTANGKLLLLATTSKVTLSELAAAIKSKGAVDAVSLDGGGSTCLYYRGKLLVPPQRKLSNMLVIYDRPPY